MTAQYRIATGADFDHLWDRNIAENPDEPMWPVWRERFRQRIALGQAVTFAVVIDGEPVGEGTLELDTGKAPALCNGRDTAYLSALRVRGEYQGQGHMSRLVKEMERYAAARGITRLTLGVEATETRNLGIYLHWGFTEFLFSQTEEGTLVLYYGKTLR